MITRGLEVAVGLTDYWLGRHPAEGLDWLARLIEAGTPDAALRAEALLAESHLCYWVTDFARGDELGAEAEALFRSLGDALGEGRALRRRGALAAATDDMPLARALLEASLARLEEAGVDAEIGTTLLHLGSLLADEGITDGARSALERSLAIAAKTGDPLANGHALAALNLAHWKGGDLEAALATGNEALLIFRELGHRPTEGTVAYRLAAVARGMNCPRAARRYALLAIDAGERSSTRTTIALGHLNLARLDVDTGDSTSAAAHLLRALDLIDPDTDRWVLVEALEATARLLVALDRAGSLCLCWRQPRQSAPRSGNRSPRPKQRISNGQCCARRAWRVTRRRPWTRPRRSRWPSRTSARSPARLLFGYVARRADPPLDPVRERTRRCAISLRSRCDRGSPVCWRISRRGPGATYVNEIHLQQPPARRRVGARANRRCLLGRGGEPRAGPSAAPDGSHTPTAAQTAASTSPAAYELSRTGDRDEHLRAAAGRPGGADHRADDQRQYAAHELLDCQRRALPIRRGQRSRDRCHNARAVPRSTTTSCPSTGGNVSPITGIGDRAFQDFTDGSGLVVLFGRFGDRRLRQRSG